MAQLNSLLKSKQENTEKFFGIQTGAMSVRGREKPSNDDFVFHRTTQMPGGHPIALLVVCDGMGGHQVGSFASELATHIITAELGSYFPIRTI